MSNNKLYQQLNKSAQQESMDFDQDAMWSAIASQLDKKRRPLGFFLLLFGAAFSIGIAGLWFVNYGMSGSHSNKTATVQQIESNNLTATNKNNDEKSNKTTLSISSSNSADEKNTRKGLVTSNQMNIITSNDHAENKGHESTQNQNSTIKSKITSENRLKQKSSHPNKSIIPTIHKANQSAANANMNARPDLSVPKTINSTLSNKSARNEIDRENLNQTSDGTSTSPVAQKSNQNALSYRLTTKNNTLTPLDTRSISTLKISLNGLAYQPLADKRDWSRCEIKQPWHFLLEAYAGFGYPLMKHASKDPMEGSDYLANWEEVQSPVGGFQAGAAFVLQSPGGFEFTGGFEHQHVVQKLESSSTTTTTETIWNPMAYFIIDANGNKVYYADSTTSTIIKTDKRVNEIRHRLMNIPIKIGYVTPFGDWNLGAHAGVTLHLSHVVDGVILQPNGSYLEIDKNNSEIVYKKDIGISYTADIHIGRQISDNLELFIRPEFRYHSDSWTSTSNELKTEIQLAQLQAGMRYTIK